MDRISIQDKLIRAQLVLMPVACYLVAAACLSVLLAWLSLLEDDDMAMLPEKAPMAGCLTCLSTLKIGRRQFDVTSICRLPLELLFSLEIEPQMNTAFMLLLRLLALLPEPSLLPAEALWFFPPLKLFD